MPGISYPSDLANRVAAKLNARNTDFLHTSILQELFEVMYFSSLKTEEGERITYSVCYMNPDNPDPDQPRTIRADRWTYVPIQPRVAMNVDNMVKLAKATDPRTSSFAVYQDQGGLYVWALVDQSNSYHQFASYDAEEGFERPGLFQADLLGVGHIRVTHWFERIAELSSGQLLPEPLDVLEAGPVRVKLDSPIEPMLSTILPLVQGTNSSGRSIRDRLSDARVIALRRLLLRIQGFGHGGAILITPEARNVEAPNLNIRNSLLYIRLRTALEELVRWQWHRHGSMEAIHALSQLPEQAIPYSLYDRYGYSKLKLEDVNAEVDNTIWFLSVLARIDGLVLFTPELELRGFGVIIRNLLGAVSTTPAATNRNATNPMQGFIEIAEDVGGTHILPKPSTNYGTRHQSMLQYCSSVEGSIGFVVSQDGGVRAITQVNGRVVMWENIQLQREFPSASVVDHPPTFTFGAI